MTKSVLFVTGQPGSSWLPTVKEAVAPLGRLQSISEEDAETEIARIPYDLAIIDAATVKNAVALVSQLHSQRPEMPIVVATLSRGWRRAREALRAGATDYIPKSLNKEELSSIIANLLGHTTPTSSNSLAEKSEHSISKKTILLADNDPDFLATRKEFMQQAGYVVVLASNPTEARQKLEVGGIDLAILDLRLKDDDDDRDLSGLILAKRVARSVPKIILTNFPTYEYVREALRPQLDGLPVAVDFLAKREGPMTLLTTVQDILETVAAEREGAQQGRKVFIAHGHDLDARNSVTDFLQGIGIRPIVLFEEADRGDTIVEKLERCCREADFAIVLLTPDDFGYPKENPNEIKPRARQNVIFELGYLAARLSRRRVRVLYRGVEIPTNFLGVLYIEMDNAGKWKSYLIRELRDAGIPVIAKATV
jgi:predicted nucleotide-binding protein/DNA-binding NarL/FixJ family response regulator